MRFNYSKQIASVLLYAQTFAHLVIFWYVGFQEAISKAMLQEGISSYFHKITTGPITPGHEVYTLLWPLLQALKIDTLP